MKASGKYKICGNRQEAPKDEHIAITDDYKRE